MGVGSGLRGLVAVRVSRRHEANARHNRERDRDNAATQHGPARFAANVPTPVKKPRQSAVSYVTVRNCSGLARALL